MKNFSSPGIMGEEDPWEETEATCHRHRSIRVEARSATVQVAPQYLVLATASVFQIVDM